MGETGDNRYMEGSARSARRVRLGRSTWRAVGLGAILLAAALTGAGLVLAGLQAEEFNTRLMAQTRQQAQQLAVTGGDLFSRQLTATLRSVAYACRVSGTDVRWLAGDFPEWVDGIYVFDGSELHVKVPPDRHEQEVAALIEKHLEGRPAEVPREAYGLRPVPVYAELEGKEVVLELLQATGEYGVSIVVATRVRQAVLRQELLAPLVALTEGLELVPTERVTADWAQPLPPAMGAWSLQSAAPFVQAQRSRVLAQTLAYMGLTLLALLTLLAAMWFLIRVVRREIALATMKSNFVADVSHELKTPLALIRLFGETLQSGRVSDPEKQREYYQIITRESTRLTNLIDNILDFSRIDAGRKEYLFAPVDPVQVVRETYDAYRAELDHKGFTHELTVDEPLPHIRADRDSIAQVLLNLMNNAVKYSQEERDLRISVGRDTRRGRHGVLVSIADRGIGIKPEDRAHLFEGFFRAADGEVRRQRGTGLGLAVVKHIVDAHQGSLDVESRLVKGTTFRIFLPAAEPDPDADRSSPAST